MSAPSAILEALDADADRALLFKGKAGPAVEFAAIEADRDVFLWDVSLEAVHAGRQSGRIASGGPRGLQVEAEPLPDAAAPVEDGNVARTVMLAPSAAMDIQTTDADATATVAPASLVFRDGLNGYAGTQDTVLLEEYPTRNSANGTNIAVDTDPLAKQALLKFAGLFGTGPGQIPPGAEIISATLSLTTTNKGDGASLYRMASDWSESTSTWAAWGGNGIQANGTEAFIAPELVTGVQPRGVSVFDVTDSLNDWSLNPNSNFGWAFLASGSDGWDFASSESATKPQLSVQYRVADGGPVNTLPVANNDSAVTQKGRAVTLDVLANDTDADQDPLSISAFGQAANGTVTLNSNGTLTYTPRATFEGADSFTYQASDGRGGTDSATVQIQVTGQSLAASFVATQDATGWLRNMQHDNAAKSFYHDGQWFAVLPDNGFWYVHKEGSAAGGWQIAGSKLMDAGRMADVQYDEATGSLYVLQASSSSTKPMLYKLTYNSGNDTWNTAGTVQLGGLDGELSGVQWQKNIELTLGIDPVTHLPIVTSIGPATAPGLRLAYATDSSLANWAQTMIDPDTNSVGGSNGNSKADIVSYRAGDGSQKIAIVYSADGASTDNWRSVSHDAGGNYTTSWTSRVITGNVNIDNHISSVSDGNRIYMVMKDDENRIWFTSGTPETGWSTPKLAVGVGAPSRPTLVLDETHDRLYLFYQESTWDPYGSIFMKQAGMDGTGFDPASLGTEIMTAGNGQDMIDPQVPAHAVGADTGGYFYLFAKNQDASSIWYNDVFV